MALVLGRRVVPAAGGVLLHLPENPRVSGGGTADHDSVATCLADHALRVFRRVDIAVTDDRNLHSLLHCGNNAPVGGAGIALQARAWMHGDAFDSYVLGHLSDLDRDDRVFIPSCA